MFAATMRRTGVNGILSSSTSCAVGSVAAVFDEDKKFRDFEDLVLTEGLLPLISTYTHHRPQCKKTCIDNILTNVPENVLYSGSITNRISHHLPIYQFSSVHIVKSKTDKVIQYYEFSNSNVNKFLELLSRDLTGPADNDEPDFKIFLATYQ